MGLQLPLPQLEGRIWIIDKQVVRLTLPIQMTLFHEFTRIFKGQICADFG